MSEQRVADDDVRGIIGSPRNRLEEGLALDLRDARAEIARLRKALRKIETYKGYNSDPLVSSSSICIGAMKDIARAALGEE